MKYASSPTSFAKKSLGQNFLVDTSYINKIINALGPSKSDTVVEIGPGRGALTESIFQSGADVVAIELDTALARAMADRFSDAGNFRLIEADALSVDFEEALKARSVETDLSPAKLVANLPYYISTAILQKLVAQRHLFSTLVLMFQREVAERIGARPGESARGYLTVLVQAAFEVERLFDVPPTAFSPSPKVWSSVVRLLPEPENEFDTGSFRNMLKAAFGQKRKTIANNLRQEYSNYSLALSKARIDPVRRAESLTLEEWARLSKALNSQYLSP